jgi:hypothetical protein
MTGIDAEPDPDGLTVVAVELLGPDTVDELAAELTGTRDSNETRVACARRIDADQTLPQRRRHGIDTASNGIVCLVEDTTRLAPGWDSALRDAFRDSDVAIVWGRVTVDAALPARFRALGRMEYGRFDGACPNNTPAGNAFALRKELAQDCLDPDEGVIEHELARRLSERGLRAHQAPGLESRYWRADHHGAALATRFGHGRIYGAGRAGNRLLGAGRAALALPILMGRALRAARLAGPPRQWLGELPWIFILSTAWCTGEFTGQILGAGSAERSWR